MPFLTGEEHRFAPDLVRLIDRVVTSAATEDAANRMQKWERGGIWNDEHILAALLRCAEKLVTNAKAKEILNIYFERPACLQAILRVFHWNREIMQTIAPLSEIWQTGLRHVCFTLSLIKGLPISSLANDVAKPLLLNLRSADSSLRLSALRILSATIQPASQDPAASLASIWSLCVQIESSEISLRNVRERTTLIARLGRLLTILSDDEQNTVTENLPHIIGYLLAQLKVNYRPLYAETVSALAGIGALQGELIWSMVWQDLERMSITGGRQMLDLDIQKPKWAADVDKGGDGPRVEAEEEEEDFRCHNLEKGDAVVASAWDLADSDQHLDVKEVSVGAMVLIQSR